MARRQRVTERTGYRRGGQKGLSTPPGKVQDTIDPTGRFIVSGNQRAYNVTTFRINRGDEGEGNGQQSNSQGEDGQGGGGSLTFTGNYTPVGSPSGMVFLT